MVRKKSIKTNSEETKTSELAHKNIDTVITVFHMFKKPEEGQNMLCGDIEDNFRKPKL